MSVGDGHGTVLSPTQIAAGSGGQVAAAAVMPLSARR